MGINSRWCRECPVTPIHVEVAGHGVVGDDDVGDIRARAQPLQGVVHARDLEHFRPAAAQLRGVRGRAGLELHDHLAGRSVERERRPGQHKHHHERGEDGEQGANGA